MRLRIEISTGSDPTKREPSTSTSPPPDASRAWAVISEAWSRIGDASGENRTRQLHWIGGALAVYALFTGENAEQLRDGLMRSNPLPAEAQPVPHVELRPGRSTPPPPRSPGAQRVVDDLSTP